MIQKIPSHSPSLNALYEELRRFLYSRGPDIDIWIIVLKKHADYDRALVLVPTADDRIYTLDSVYLLSGYTTNVVTFSIIEKIPSESSS